jgi:glucose-1-phosphate thymidylyltransferase
MHGHKDNKPDPEIIGLIPAGGKATRLAPLPCSKELYPIGFCRTNQGHVLRPKVVCQYLLEKMRLAGISKAYIILREGKWDIPAYLGDGTSLNMHLAYLTIRVSPGVPYTLDQAYPFAKDKIVAFGFPDIMFNADHAFKQLLAKQANTHADIVLGLFPVDQPRKWHMVELDRNQRIRKIVINPVQTELDYTWIIAVWTPVFSEFIYEYLRKDKEAYKRIKVSGNVSGRREVFMSDVIQSAVDDALHVQGVLFPSGSCLDIGTLEDLVEAVRTSASHSV